MANPGVDVAYRWIREGNYKLIVPSLEEISSEFSRPQKGLFFHPPHRNFSAIRQDDHKLMLYWKKGGGIDRLELFDVDRMPTEEGNDIAKEHPEIAEALLDRLLAHLDLVGADREWFNRF